MRFEGANFLSVLCALCGKFSFSHHATTERASEEPVKTVFG